MIVAAVPSLRLDADHVYWLGSRRLDGVTEVLAGVGIADIEWVTPKALSRGRAVHHACHLIDTVGLAWATLHEDLHGYVRAWERCKRETRMEIIDSEQARYHPTLGFAGTRDRRVLWDGHRYKIDIKTVGEPGVPGPNWTRFQTAAYDLLDPGPRENPDRRAAIILYPDGSWRPDIHHEFSDAACFLSFLTTFRCLKMLGKI